MHKVGVILVVTLGLHLVLREMVLVVEVLHRQDNNKMVLVLMLDLVVMVQDIH